MRAMRRRRIPRVLVAFWIVAAAGLVLGCADGDDDDDGGGGGPCVAVCEEQNDLCDDDEDCASECQELNATAAETGCENELDAVLSCIAGLDACDEDETLCSTDAYATCLDQFCVDNPDDDLC